MNSGKFRRRNYFVGKRIQSRYILYAVAFVVIGAFMVWWETRTTVNSVLKQIGVQDMDIEGVLGILNQVVLIKVAIGVILIATIAVFLSHYIAGPIYRLEKSINAVRDGDLSFDVHFRKKDELKGIEVAFNKMTIALHKKLSYQHELIEQIVKKNKDLIDILNQKGLSEQAKAIEETDKDLNTLCDDFKL
ncbi:MAG: methyl-accepting chemotaxis protein [bacterium]